MTSPLRTIFPKLLAVVFMATLASSKCSGQLTPAQAKARADEIVKDLREAAAEARKINDKPLREKIELRLGRAELKARELADELSRVRPAATPGIPGPLPLSQPEFDKLLQGLRKESFDDRRLAYIENFALIRPLSCAQATTLLKSFSFDENRVKATKALYPHLIDRQSFNDVLGAFTFESGRAEARKAVGLK
ncbi:DUF4476 domain-containing protein [Aquisphaera insulae]|uniref:DUF4476 domain-containing protein n=1 Tax=Aquisphaera insulae TaxID=2712864 RepID=UPI0013E9BA1E|nr:DUF4476 domain-containing protein [Aquisphaera insulae]